MSEIEKYKADYTRALAIAEQILVLAGELDRLDEQAFEYNFVTHAEDAINSYKSLLEDLAKNPEGWA